MYLMGKMGDDRSSVGERARYTLLCCGFDSRLHTQILYKVNSKGFSEHQKNVLAENITLITFPEYLTVLCNVQNR